MDSTEAAPAAAPRSGIRRGWLRALVALAALLLLWAAAALYVPPIVASQLEKLGAQQLGRRVTAGKVEFNPWKLELTLTDVVVAGAAPAAPPLLSVRRVFVDVAAQSVLRFAPVIDGLEIDAPMLRLRRVGDGRYDVDDVLQRLAATPADATRSDEPARFAVHNIVVRDGGADFVDQPLQATHKLRAVELGVPFISSLPSEREVKVEPRLAFTLDGSRFDTAGAATPFAERGNGELRVRVEGFDVVPYLGYLPRGLPAQLRAATLATDLRIAFEQRPKLSLNVTGTASASGIEVVDPRAQELLRVGSVRLAIDELRPLERRVALRSIEVEAPHLVGVRNATGKVNLMLAAESPTGAATPVAAVPLPTSAASGTVASSAAPGASAAAASAPTAVGADSSWRATVASLSVRAGRLDWQDATTSPAAKLGVDGFVLDAQAIAWPLATPVAFKGEGSIGAGKERGRLIFSGSGHTTGANVELSLAALPLAPFQPYLNAFLAEPLTGALSADLKVGWRPSGGTPNLQVDARRLAVARLGFGNDKIPAIAADEIELGDARVDTAARTASIGRAVLRGPRLRLERDSERRWAFERWAAPRAKAPTTGDAHSPAGAARGVWKLAVDEFAVERGRVGFEDRSIAVPASLDVRDIAVQLRGWTLEGAAAAPFRIAARVAVPEGRGSTAPGSRAAAGSSVVGSVEAKGELKGFAGGVPRSAQASLLLRDLPLHLFDPYLDTLLDIDVHKAQTSFKGAVAWEGRAGGPVLTLRGDGTVDEFRASNESTERPAGQRGLALVRGAASSGRELLSWKSASLRGIDLALAPGAPTRLAVAETTLNDFFARLVLDENGRLNLQDIARGEPVADSRAAGDGSASAAPGVSARAPESAPGTAPARAAASAPSRAASPPGQAPILEFGPITVVGGRVNYTDRFVRPNYSANLSELSGRLGAFSSQAPAGGVPLMADVSLRGRVQGTASLEISGKANPLARPLALDLQAKVRDLELPPLSPYAIKYAGYGIERGKMSVDLAYVVQPDGQLTASNKIVLNQLAFGDKDETSKASLPVKLAVALLTDRNGIIDLDLPVSGSLNDPQFSLGGVIWKVITNLVVKAVTAPFSLLASAFDGGGGGESSRIEFAPGTSSLGPAARENLDKLAKALADRPALKLTVVGESRLDGEAEAWKKERLQQLVRGEKRRQSGGRGGARTGAPVGTGAGVAGPDTAASAPEDTPSAPRGSARAPGEGAGAPGTSAARQGNDVSVGEAEYPALLKEVYRRADIVKPKNVLGMAKDIPVAEMEALLLGGITVDAEAMQQLAVRRGVVVRDYLASRDIPTARLFLGAPKTAGSESSWTPRADLKIGT